MREFAEHRLIGLDAIRERALTDRLAGIIKTGELAGSLKFNRLMQQLKYDVDIDRETISQQVLDWVAEQPDIKRQSIAREVSIPGNQLIVSPGALEKLREIAKQSVAPLSRQ
jgi:hypothetical protein